MDFAYRYEGQLETADAADATALTPDTGAAAAAPPPLGAAAEQSAGEAKPPGSHVPTVMTKLQKWGDYESFGEPVWPTNFIPMKTPLSHEILDNWQLPEAPKHRLTVSTLLEAEKAAGRRVGLLLDLSNHGEPTAPGSTGLCFDRVLAVTVGCWQWQ